MIQILCVTVTKDVFLTKRVRECMLGGWIVDNFMDKLAQKLSAQEMIKANAAAEAAKDAVNGSRYATLRKEFTDSFRSGFGLGEETATVFGHGMTGRYVYGTMTGVGKSVLD